MSRMPWCTERRVGLFALGVSSDNSMYRQQRWYCEAGSLRLRIGGLKVNVDEIVLIGEECFRVHWGLTDLELAGRQG